MPAKKITTKLQPGEYYLIVAQSLEPLPLFFREANYILMRRLLNEISGDALNILAYTLCKHEVFLVIEVLSPEASESLRRCFSKYALSINKQQLRRGGLFVKPFRRYRLDDQEAVKEAVIKIHKASEASGDAEEFSNHFYSSLSDLERSLPASPADLSFLKRLLGCREKRLAQHGMNEPELLWHLK